MKIFYLGFLDLQTDIHAKRVNYAIFGFLGPYNNYTCYNSMVSGMARRPRDHSKPYQKVTHVGPLIFLDVFLKIKKRVFQSTISGHLFRIKYLEMQI
jgi:hypothetical protein